MATYTCAICRRDVAYDGPQPALYPFCSPRCKLVDLGHWLHGHYSIDGDVPTDEDADQLPDAPGDPPAPPRGPFQP